MPALAPTLRDTLEKTVIAARDLAVDAREPFPSISPEQCGTRVTLRAWGKQLGDGL